MLRWSLFALVVAACAPSGPSGDSSVDVVMYGLAIASPDPSAPDVLAQDASIDLRLGFQGFRYIRVALVATGDAPSVTPARATLEIDGFDRAEQLFSAVDLRLAADGRRVSAPLMIFANDVAPAAANGRHARLTIVLDDRRRRAEAVLDGLVRWDPDCIEGPDFQCRSLSDGGANEH
ncbi:MAG: hypothetical protein U0269_00165 [Polyangiales bacterium]